jgi:hypothetical protein
MKYFVLILLFVSIGILTGFPQGNTNSVIINKKVEVVDYDYEYVYVDFLSSVVFSIYYPFLAIETPSVRQQFFEKGRNIRPGYELGVQQGIKVGSWVLYSGVSCQNYTEYFSYSEYPIRQVTIQEMDGSLHAIQVADGDPVQYSRFNRLNYLTIPVCLSYYPKVLKGLFGLTVEGKYHYLLSSDYVAKFSIIEPVMTIGKQEFNPSFFSLAGSISYHQKLYKNFSVTIEPYFSLGLSKLIEQKDLTFGMDAIGLNTRFYLVY